MRHRLHRHSLQSNGYICCTLQRTASTLQTHCNALHEHDQCVFSVQHSSRTLSVRSMSAVCLQCVCSCNTLHEHDQKDRKPQDLDATLSSEWFPGATTTSEGRIVWCSVLQCVAVCCSMLQCVAVCCSVLQCVAVCCSVIWICWWIERCSALQCVAGVLRFSTKWYPDATIYCRVMSNK